MNSFLHFISKHRNISKIICTILLGVYSFILLGVLLDASIKSCIVCFVLMNLFLYMWIDMTPNVIMSRTVKDLYEKCDPYPLLSETEKLLTYKNSKSIKDLIMMNHAVGLSDTGKYQEAYDLQKSINIDKRYVPLHKCIYYHNLFEFCMNLEKYEEAGIWYEKFVQVCADTKSKRDKKALESLMIVSKAMEEYRKGEYLASINTINTRAPKNARENVSNAMTYAMSCIALGENEKAADALAIVIRNGNRLYCVNEAAAMLRKIRGIEE